MGEGAEVCFQPCGAVGFGDGFEFAGLSVEFPASRLDGIVLVGLGLVFFELVGRYGRVCAEPVFIRVHSGFRPVGFPDERGPEVRVDIGDLTQGQVVALINYMSQILVELVKLANLIISVTKAAACLNRVESVLAVKPDMNEGDVRWKSNSSEADRDLKNKIPVVEFSHVSLTYKGTSDTSLSDINFCAEKGQTIGIIGGTGSGKSSLVNLIPRFYDATDGTVKINGRDIKEYQTENLREHIGVVLQKAVLFKGSIADNLRWGKEDATEQEMYEALDISQAREFVDTKQGGLEFQIEQGGRNLSGGQKQRMTIARALVRKPEILILDDSASALDFATDAALRKSIKEMKNQPTVFIVSQRAASIQYADQIIVLDDGAMAGIGTHEELLKDCPVYQEIYYSQFPKEAVVNG